jgi:fructokinase
VHLLKVNQEEAELVTGINLGHSLSENKLQKAGDAILAKGPEMVVITLGDQGCYFCIPQGGDLVPAFPVEVVDTVGCGDAFMGALLCSLAEDESWRDNLHLEKMEKFLIFANAAGALTSQKQGAIPALPSRDQVEDFLNQAGK